MESIIIQENEKNLSKAFLNAREKIRKNKSNEIIFSSDNDDLNRKILEKEKIHILLINQLNRKDKLKQRDSGLNHVLAKIAKKKGIKIGINLDEIINVNNEKKSGILGRVIQNIKLCNKNKIQMKFIQQKCRKNIHLIKSFGLVLGMPTWMTKGL
jgi:RNase P/RNase MRP subunit p30